MLNNIITSNNRHTTNLAFVAETALFILSKERYFRKVLQLRGEVSFAHSTVVRRRFNLLSDEEKQSFGYIFGQIARKRFGLTKGRRVRLHGITPTIFMKNDIH